MDPEDIEAFFGDGTAGPMGHAIALPPLVPPAVTAIVGPPMVDPTGGPRTRISAYQVWLEENRDSYIHERIVPFDEESTSEEEEDDDSSDEDEGGGRVRVRAIRAQKRARARDTVDDDDDDDTNPGPHRRARQSSPHEAQYPFLVGVRSECTLCGFGDRYYDGIDKNKLAKFHNIIKTYVDKCPFPELASMLAVHWKEHIYDPYSNEPIVTQPMAQAHLEENHPNSSVIWLVLEIRAFGQYNDTIDKRVLDNPMRDLDIRLFDRRIASSKHILNLRNQDPSKMILGDSLDVSIKATAYTNIMSGTTERKDRRQRRRRTQTPLERMSRNTTV